MRGASKHGMCGEWSGTHNISSEVEQRLRGYVRLTDVEEWWAYKRKLQENDQPIPMVSGGQNLTEAIIDTIKHSKTGCFVSEWNNFPAALSDSIAMINLKKEDDKEICWYDNEENLIKTLLTEVNNGHFSLKKLKKKITMLRLVGKKIKNIDGGFSMFPKLHSVVMSLNWINSLKWSDIPLSIRFLDLLGNEISSFENIDESNDNLLYLCLSRNFLSQRTNMNMISHFHSLFFLDLSNNNLEDIKQVLSSLLNLNNLRALNLFGNPCSFIVSYRRTVTDHLPELITLDDISLREYNLNDPYVNWQEMNDVKKRTSKGKLVTNVTAEKEVPSTPGLVVTLYKITNIAKEKRSSLLKEMRASEGYKMEVECPLINNSFIEEEKTLILEEPEVFGVEISKVTKPKPSARRIYPKIPKEWKFPPRPDFKTCFDSKTNVQSGIFYESDHQIGTNCPITYSSEEVPISACVSSKIFKWSKNMTSTVTIPTERLLGLRDTFRTVLNVYIVYVIYKQIRSPDPKEVAKEMIFERKVLAKIQLPLECLKWNEELLLYKWSSDDPGWATRVNIDGVMTYKKGKIRIISSKSKKNETLEPPTTTAVIGVSTLSEERSSPGYLVLLKNTAGNKTNDSRNRSRNKALEDLRNKTSTATNQHTGYAKKGSNPRKRTTAKKRKIGGDQKRQKYKKFRPDQLPRGEKSYNLNNKKRKLLRQMYIKKFIEKKPDPLMKCIEKCQQSRLLKLDKEKSVDNTPISKKQTKCDHLREPCPSASTPRGSNVDWTQFAYF